MIKVIDSIQYHIWSDALHARQLAKQTQSPWNRGAYVRWAIQTAWSAFENVCAEALEAANLGMRFRDRFDEAVANKGLPPVDWGRGLWQKVLNIYGIRKEFIHVVPGVSQERLKTPLEEANRAIDVLRNAVIGVSNMVGLPHPPWVNDDTDAGWDAGQPPTATAYKIHSGARADHPENVRITYVLKGKEHLSEIAPPDADYHELLSRLLRSLNIPVDFVRAYCGTTLIKEIPTKMRT